MIRNISTMADIKFAKYLTTHALSTILIKHNNKHYRLDESIPGLNRRNLN